jgi:hypothetical protein
MGRLTGGCFLSFVREDVRLWLALKSRWKQRHQTQHWVLALMVHSQLLDDVDFDNH